MNKSFVILMSAFAAALTTIAQPYPAGPLTAAYPRRIQDGSLFEMTGYHQQKDWTCGPAACLMVEKYYFPNSTLTEAQIEPLVGCTEDMGTALTGIQAFFSRPGWTVQVKENATVDEIEKAIRKGVPTIVGWCDWGGHWCIPVGYDLRKGKDTFWQDDLIIFRDPYDQTDDVVDAYTDFALWRFNDMWEEYNYITPGRKNSKLLIVPIPANPEAHRTAAHAAPHILTNP